MARQFSGARLRAARLNAGLKPEQLAVRINRSVWMVQRYEHGAAAPTAPILGALADELGCAIDDLYAGEAVRDAA